ADLVLCIKAIPLLGGRCSPASCSVTHIDELVDALDPFADENESANKTLQMQRLESEETVGSSTIGVSSMLGRSSQPLLANCWLPARRLLTPTISASAERAKIG